MAHSPSLFSIFTDFNHPMFLSLADGSKVPALGKTSVSMNTNLILHNVLLVPSFPISLLSVKQLCSTRLCHVIFTPSCCIFQDMRSKRVIGRGWLDGTLYYLWPAQQVISNASLCSSSSTTLQWHLRLGHLNLNKLKLMMPSLCSISQVRCDSCELSKHRLTSLPSYSPSRSNKLFEIIHLIFGVPQLFLILDISSTMYCLLMIIAACHGFI